MNLLITTHIKCKSCEYRVGDWCKFHMCYLIFVFQCEKWEHELDSILNVDRIIETENEDKKFLESLKNGKKKNENRCC